MTKLACTYCRSPLKEGKAYLTENTSQGEGKAFCDTLCREAHHVVAAVVRLHADLETVCDWEARMAEASASCAGRMEPAAAMEVA